jgi:hypothetical protein
MPLLLISGRWLWLWSFNPARHLHLAPPRQGAAPLNLDPPKPEAVAERGVPRRVVYVPACVTRIMGPSKGDYETGACPLSQPLSTFEGWLLGLPCLLRFYVHAAGQARPRSTLEHPCGLRPIP